MPDKDKTKAQLLEETARLRRRVAQLEAKWPGSGQPGGGVPFPAASDAQDAIYRLLFDNADVLVSMYDRNGICLLMNTLVAKNFGGVASDFEGKSLRELHPEAADEYLRRIGEVIDSGEARHYESLVKFPDGNRWLLSNCHPVRDQAGVVFASAIISQDITERKKAQSQMDRLVQITETTSDLVATATPDSQVTYMNTAGLRMLGWPKDERGSGKSISDAHPPWALEIVKNTAIPSAIAHGIWTGESALLGPDQQEISVSQVIMSHWSSQGELEYLSTIMRDISQIKAAEAAFREKEETLSKLFTTTPAWISITSFSDGRYLDVNDAFCTISGFTREEAIGHTSAELGLWPKESDREKYTGLLTQHGYFVNQEVKLLRKNGEILVGRWFAELIELGGDTYILSSVVDATQSQRAEKVMRIQRDAALALASASSLDEALPICLEAAVRISGLDCGAVYLADPSASGLKMAHAQGLSSEFLEMMDYYPAESPNAQLIFKGQPVYLKQQQLLARLGGQVGEAKSDPENMEGLKAGAVVPMVHQDKVIGCLNLASHSLDEVPSFARGALESLVTHLGQVITRLQTEETLHASEKRYRTLFNNITDFVYTHDIDGVMKTINPYAAQSLGYAQAEVIGHNIKDFMPEKVRAGFDQDFLVAIRTEGKIGGIMALLDRQGNRRYLEYKSTLVSPEGEEPYISGSGRDVTQRLKIKRELRKLQEQLTHSQKMEAVGTLASGVAHDFNNILQAISGYVQIMALDSSSQPGTAANLAKIDAAVERAAELIRRLLTFSRKEEISLAPLDLNAEVQRAVKMLERSIPKMVSMETHLAKDLKRVNGDPIQMEQILMNLGINASDAMPGGGQLVIETCNTLLDQAYCSVHPDAKPGLHVHLRVSDTGAGMDKKTALRVFEPFFTTKGVGQGSGLGLATVYGIVKSCSGHITCYSEPGQGTVFNIYFPALDQAEQPRPEDQASTAAAIRGDETILLVDDEEAILEASAEFMAQHGYRVLTAASGEEALEIYQKHGRDIALVILDLGMPGMGGKQCLIELLRFDPQAMVLIASGYNLNGQARDITDIGAAAFVSKPYGMNHLLAKVRGLLDEP